MKMLLVCLLVIGAGVSAEERVKRQATYTFPGPRSDRSYSRQAAAGYPQQPPQQPQNAPAVYVEESDEGEQYHQQQHQPRRQFQGQPVQQQYAPAAPQRGPPAAPAYEPPRAPAPAPRQQSYGAPPQAPPKRRPAASTSSRANKYGSAPQQSLNGGQDDDEEDQGPDPLTLLLEDSQFTCGSKNDGYYADDSVNCQVFHYCVSGAKHSWMCPEGTVFHQVHLNCVPDSQDICSQSQKFHFVNEYLYKPVDYDGPNNTARYSQRYYPDGYVVGDPIVAPQDQPAPRRPAQPPQVQSYPAPAPAPRQQSRQLAPPAPPAYRQQQPSQADRYSQGSSRPVSRPASRPVESYPEEAPQVYRGPPPTQAAPQPQPQPQQIYRVIPPQATPPAPQGYRGTPPQAVPQTYRVSPQGPPSPPPGYSEENLYQPPPQQRRPSVPSQRSSSGYAPPRQLYRSTSGRSASGYPVYGAGANNQAAGVQYDEDY